MLSKMAVDVDVWYCRSSVVAPCHLVSFFFLLFFFFFVVVCIFDVLINFDIVA